MLYGDCSLDDGLDAIPKLLEKSGLAIWSSCERCEPLVETLGAGEILLLGCDDCGADGGAAAWTIRLKSGVFICSWLRLRPCCCELGVVVDATVDVVDAVVGAAENIGLLKSGSSA